MDEGQILGVIRIRETEKEEQGIYDEFLDYITYELKNRDRKSVV